MVRHDEHQRRILNAIVALVQNDQLQLAATLRIQEMIVLVPITIFELSHLGLDILGGAIFIGTVAPEQACVSQPRDDGIRP